MTHTSSRAPVLVGVGTALDAGDDAEAVELMVRAVTAAGDDCGVPAVLRAVQQVAVPRGTWSYTDPGRIIRDRIGAPDARTVLVDLGIPQQTLLNDAMAAIQQGALDVAIVVGGEAKARAARARRRSTAADAAGIADVMRRERPTEGEASEIDQGGVQPDVHQTPTQEIVSAAEIEARLWAPIEQYALIESALGAAEHLGVDEHRRAIGSLWARFNEVAQDNPEAAFPSPMTAADLSRFSESNRPIAFPYGKWHASQWTVDQAAALLLCSTEAADRFGIPPERRVHPLVGLESSFAIPLTNRSQLHRWPAMGVLGRAAEAHLGRPLSSCEHVELYSCFPVAVRVQQRELGLPPTATPTITGGMTFAGGPFNSFVLHATAAMARRLRAHAGTGIVTTVSGLLTKPGLAIWSSEPGDGALVADLHAQASAATATVESVTGHHGPARVAAATVTYERGQPHELIAIVDTEAGARAIVRSTDEGLVEATIAGGIVGRTITV
jgi:acetyl-CoA C-acetyltransferase